MNGQHYYHGSRAKGLSQLVPQVSQHEKPYVYLTVSEVLATLYTVDCIWYSYGFNDDGVVVYDEWYPNALHDIYSGRVGYIYDCMDVDNLSNPTKIPMVLVSQKAVTPISCIEIADVYEKLKEYEQKGLLIIRTYDKMSQALRDWYLQCAEKEIAEGKRGCEYLKGKIELLALTKQYQQKPCATLATAFWKKDKFPAPEGLMIVHKDNLPNNADIIDSYFKLIHYPRNDYEVALDKEFCYVDVSLPNDYALIAQVINECYGYKYEAEDIHAWTKYPVFDKSLWFFIKNKLTEQVVALAVADFDRSIGEGSLEWIQVLPEFQGKGFGVKIVNQSLRRLLEKGAKFVTVSGRIDNQSNPQGLYRKCGFTGHDTWLVIKA